jgi:tetrahydromethanopterin S-methyltransferase subunit B
MDTPITRAEHEEFRRRLEEENRRQDKRIELLEDNMRELNQLTASVGKLAASVESMVKEQEKQGKRLETLEGRDGELWRKVVGYVVTAVVGIVLGFVFRQVGM